jgi:hypothetical protein
MRRLTSILTVAALTATTSCGDHPSPTAATSPSGASVSETRIRQPSTARTIDLTPRGGAYRVGQYLLVVPPHAVCEPTTSSYGSGTWGQPCRPAAGRIRVTASLVTIDGRDYVDFVPHLRFVPSPDPARWVTIHAVRLAAIGGEGDLRRFSILFSETPGGPVFDESAGDSTLATHVDVTTGAVWRRIKHFTGYNVYTGLVEDCTPGVDAGCYAIGTIVRE